MIKYDSIFWTTKHRVRCRQTQRSSGTDSQIKQFCSSSTHEDTVGELLEESTNKNKRLFSSKENVPLGPKGLEKKRKQARIFTNDETYEAELKAELFAYPRNRSSPFGTRQLQAVRQRKDPKNVKFSDTGREQGFLKDKPPGEMFASWPVEEIRRTQAPSIPTRRPYIPEGEETPEFEDSHPVPRPEQVMAARIVELIKLEKARGAQSTIPDSEPELDIDEEYYYSEESEESAEATEIHTPDEFGSGNLDINDFDASNVEYVEGVDLDGYSVAGPSSTLDLDRPRVEHIEHANSAQSFSSVAPQPPTRARERARTAVFALTASDAHKRRRREAGYPGRKSLSMQHENAANFSLSNAFSAVNQPRPDLAADLVAEDVDTPMLDEPASHGTYTEDYQRDLEQILRRNLVPRLRAVDEMGVADTESGPGPDAGTEIHYPPLPEYDYAQDFDDEEDVAGQSKGKERATHSLASFDTQTSSDVFYLDRGRSRCRSVKWDRSHTRRLGRGQTRGQARRCGRWASRSESCRRGRARERSCS